jgi:hypothetical protein
MSPYQLAKEELSRLECSRCAGSGCAQCKDTGMTQPDGLVISVARVPLITWRLNLRKEYEVWNVAHLENAFKEASDQNPD